MDIELNGIMDEIMEINHQITSYMIDYAKAESKGKEIKIEDNKTLKILFERLQKCYRQLQEKIVKKYEEEKNKDPYDEGVLMLQSSVEPENIKSATIQDLERYLEECYTEIRYIDVYDYDEKVVQESMFKNKEFENLRMAEYNLQLQTLGDIDLRMKIDEKPSKLSFKEKSYILMDMALKRFYSDYAIEQIDRYIRDLDKKESSMSEREYKDKKSKLYEQKYITYYAYLNNKYNGILQENDNGKLGVIKRCIDEDMADVTLNMDFLEIEEYIKLTMSENKQILKNDIGEIIKKVENRNKKEKSNGRKNIEQPKYSEEYSYDEEEK